MTGNGDKEQERKFMARREVIKYEIASELGLTDKIEKGGWKSLTARESGRIGGLLAKREKDLRTKSNESGGA